MRTLYRISGIDHTLPLRHAKVLVYGEVCMVLDALGMITMLKDKWDNLWTT